jgi:hypothetical protein
LLFFAGGHEEKIYKREEKLLARPHFLYLHYSKTKSADEYKNYETLCSQNYSTNAIPLKELLLELVQH